MNFSEADAACQAEGATLASFKQMGDAQQVCHLKKCIGYNLKPFATNCHFPIIVMGNASTTPHPISGTDALN